MAIPHFATIPRIHAWIRNTRKISAVIAADQLAGFSIAHAAHVCCGEQLNGDAEAPVKGEILRR